MINRLGQQYVALTRLGSSISRQVAPPIHWVQEKIQKYNETKKALEEHNASIEKTRVEMPIAALQDKHSIKKASIVLANEILIKSFPDQGFNPLYTKFFMKHKDNFADSLIESLQENSETPLDIHRKQYESRKELLGRLSSDIEDRVLYNIKNGTLFTGPIKENLSDDKGLSTGSFLPLEMTAITMPENLCMTISYEKGHLRTTLLDKYDNLYKSEFFKKQDTLSYPLPHIAPVAEEVQAENKKYSIIKDSIYTKILKGLYEPKV